MSGEGLAHLVGDYCVQSEWMAAEKTSRHLPAALHAATYTACFLPITRSWRALAVIGGTHFVIDRWRLAKRLCWAKNQLAPARHRYRYEYPNDLTGYQPKPHGLDVALMIAADNTVHLLVNRWALRRFGTRQHPRQS